ncbi:MAG: hypothetical protein IIU52_00855 [Bacteroidaceae bacterium]|nr:hypothetical protein [Bacteroidaceae bacterium]MBQ5392367.1 hypothetical protein [Bacteroidaceae bacterium]
MAKSPSRATWPIIYNFQDIPDSPKSIGTILYMGQKGLVAATLSFNKNGENRIEHGSLHFVE